MLIRTFEHHDLARLTELAIEVFGPFYEDSFRPVVGEAIFARQHGQWREDYHTLLAAVHAPEHNKYAAVAEIDGVIAGFVGWEIDPSREHGCIRILAVDAHHRRDRLGTKLCEHAFSHMRTHGTVYVEISTGGDHFHAPARALYESLGCIKWPIAGYLREL